MRRTRNIMPLRPRRSFPTKVIDAAFDTARNIMRNVTGFKMKSVKQSKPVQRPKRSQGGLGYHQDMRIVDLYDVINLKLDHDIGQYYYTFSNENKNFDINETLTSSSEFTEVTRGWILFRIQKVKITVITNGQTYEITHPGTQQQTDVITERVMYPNVLWQVYNNKLESVIADNDMVRNPVNWVINPNLNKTWTKVFRLNDTKLIDRGLIGKWYAMGDTDDLPAWAIYMNADNMLPITMNATGVTQDFTVGTIHAQIYLQGVLEDTVGARLPHFKPLKNANLLTGPKTQSKGEMKPIPEKKEYNEETNNHKTRRMKKRVNIRWDKIFNENCISDDDSVIDKTQ